MAIDRERDNLKVSSLLLYVTLQVIWMNWV